MRHSVDTDSHKNEVPVAGWGDEGADGRNCNVVQEVTDSFMNCTRQFYVVRTVHFRIKLYNDQRNAQVFN
jgi:hypothetical protein